MELTTKNLEFNTDGSNRDTPSNSYFSLRKLNFTLKKLSRLLIPIRDYSLSYQWVKAKHNVRGVGKYVQF